MIYCTLLNPALDVLYHIEEMHPGQRYDNAFSVQQPSGKGVNVARVVKTLGEEVCIVGLMPERDVHHFSHYLSSIGVGGHFYPIRGSMRVNTTIREKNTGNMTHITSSGYRLSTRIQDELQEFVEKHMQSNDSWVLTGGLPQGFDNDAYMKIIQQCRKNNIGTLLDSKGLALNMGVRARPHMIKPNLTELEGFFGEQIEGVHHIALKGKKLLDMGIEFVFISLGSDGMIALHGNHCLLCSAPPLEGVVDTTGCGDALVGGILVAQKRNFSFMEICRLGIACSVSNALHTGAGMVDNDEIWRLMEIVKIEAV